MPIHLMADSLSCFDTLLENVPGWIAELEGIAKGAVEKQEEISYADRPATPTRADSKRSPIRSWPSRTGTEDRPGSPIQLCLLRPNLAHREALYSSQRKRKSSSILSDQGSGPHAVRVKLATVVYYDGDTQKRFEKLVRNIGLSRNAIRKGKMSAKVDSLSRAVSSSSEGSSSSGGEDGGHKFNYRSTRPSRMPSFGHNDGSEVFDNVDSSLEKAQGFCERAAYQVLRDGDCTLEVTHAKEHFAEALHMTKTELPGLRKRAEKAEERQRRSDQRRIAEEEIAAKRAATALALKARLQAAVAVQAVIPSDNSSLEVDPLEADDTDSEDESDCEMNVASLQFGKLSQMRTSRLAAAQ